MSHSIEQLSAMADRLVQVLDAYDPEKPGTVFTAGRSIALFMQALDEIAEAVGKSEAETAAYRTTLRYAVETMTEGRKPSSQMLADISRWRTDLNQRREKRR